MPDLRRHDSGIGLHFLDGIHVEVGKRGAAHFRVGGVEAVQGENSGGAALSVDRELLGKVGGSISVGHGAGGQQQKLAEVTGVQGKARNLSAGKAFSTTGLRGFFAGWQDANFRRLGR